MRKVYKENIHTNNNMIPSDPKGLLDDISLFWGFKWKKQ